MALIKICKYCIYVDRTNKTNISQDLCFASCWSVFLTLGLCPLKVHSVVTKTVRSMHRLMHRVSVGVNISVNMVMHHRNAAAALTFDPPSI